uniref:Chemokine interleukin-8-like domain-containing protein n=1 Tax=Echeneis naucrates TaxID=173247 RepID=A0A665VZ37_ECHNA
MTAKITLHTSCNQRPTMTALTLVSFLFLTMMAWTTSAQGGIGSCCRHISNTTVRRENLRSYYIQQQPSCQLHAVVFTTKKGRRICADPSNSWTINSIDFLKEKNHVLQRSSN